MVSTTFAPLAFSVMAFHAALSTVRSATLVLRSTELTLFAPLTLVSASFPMLTSVLVMAAVSPSVTVASMLRVPLDAPTLS